MAGIDAGYIDYNPGQECDEDKREWQGCPTVAITKGGRLFAGWFTGGAFEPCIDNYNVLVMSDDGGETWSKPIIAIYSDVVRKIRNIDVQLYVNEDNELWVMWVHSPYYEKSVRATIKTPFALDYQNEFTETELLVCKNPDADVLVWGAPRKMCNGFLRCKPVKTSGGRIIAPAYDWVNEKTYMLRYSDDGGESFYDVAVGKKPQNKVFDEPMVYEHSGVLYMLARTNAGYYARTYSLDGGNSWAEIHEFEQAPSSRLYIGTLKNGMVAYVRNVSNTARTGIKILLSNDGGKTFPWSMVLDEREMVSYPDLAEDDNGNIYVVYDRERDNRIKLDKETWVSGAAKEILISKIKVSDIIEGRLAKDSYLSKVLSRARIDLVRR